MNEQAVAQIIDLLMSNNKKMDKIIELLNILSGTITKYDNDYQNEIAKSNN